MKKYILFLVLAAVLVLVVIFQKRNTPQIVSCTQNVGPFPHVDKPTITRSETSDKVLEFYRECLQPQYRDGFLTSAQNGNSESEAYAMLQAYYAGDRETFDKVYFWVKTNLRRPSDNLFAWKFSVGADHKAQIIDSNSATDADTDIAYALLRAGADWRNQSYVDAGRQIIADIWNIETTQVGDKRYIIGGPWANQPDSVVINPSYISPQAYTVFAEYDSSHDWNKLKSDAYDFLIQVSKNNNQGLAVVPNWIALSRSQQSFSTFSGKPDSMDFSYDAFRIFWRVGLDQLFTPSAQSWNFISRAQQYENDWRTNQEMCALYVYRGNQYSCDKSTTSTLAAPISVFSVTNGYEAAQVIQKYYYKNNSLQFPDTDFYAQSWHWFAAWLWVHS